MLVNDATGRQFGVSFVLLQNPSDNNEKNSLALLLIDFEV